MKYSVDDFSAAIDPTYAASHSIVLRYRNALRFDDLGADAARFRALQEQTSLAEGLRIVSLGTYRDVAIDILDETSLMHTRTLKSIDGCVTIAHCLLRGHSSIVFESGGNTGSALACYAARAGLTSYCFVPAQNLTVLDGEYFAAPGIHLIAVEDPAQVKATAHAFAAEHGLPRVPEVEGRYRASMYIGCFLAEQLADRPPYDYLAQTISAAFGPIGIYRILGEHGARLPQFLGVQQESNCTMVRNWWAASGRGAPAPSAAPGDPLLAKVVYDREPHTHGTSDELHAILRATGGDLMTINRREFDGALQCGVGGPDLLRGLEAGGIKIATEGGEVLEKTGLLGLAGTLKQIDAGRIQAGMRVLACLTGGTAQPRRAVVPERFVRAANAAAALGIGSPQ